MEVVFIESELKRHQKWPKAVLRFLVQRIHKTRLISCEIAHYYESTRKLNHCKVLRHCHTNLLKNFTNQHSRYCECLLKS
jgi:hypothetical protein